MFDRIAGVLRSEPCFKCLRGGVSGRDGYRERFGEIERRWGRERVGELTLANPVKISYGVADR